jgi:hypothetical protein
MLHVVADQVWPSRGVQHPTRGVSCKTLSDYEGVLRVAVMQRGSPLLQPIEAPKKAPVVPPQMCQQLKASVPNWQPALQKYLR